MPPLIMVMNACLTPSVSSSEAATAVPADNEANPGASSERTELVGEAESPLTKAQLCQVACATVANMGCAAVGVARSGATVISVGGLVIPCAAAIIGACGAYGAAGAICVIQCAGN